jgi:hypothetical protein
MLPTKYLTTSPARSQALLPYISATNFLRSAGQLFDLWATHVAGTSQKHRIGLKIVA